MMDVVPPTGGRPHFAKALRGRHPPVRKKGQSNNVLKLEWKLPARLSKSWNQDKGRARRVKNQSSGFVRRELKSSLPNSRPPQFGSQSIRSVNKERHTADVYMNSRADVQFTAPPYGGSFSQGGSQNRAAGELTMESGGRGYRANKPEGRLKRVASGRMDDVAPGYRGGVTDGARRKKAIQGAVLGVERDLPYEFAVDEDTKLSSNGEDSLFVDHSKQEVIKLPRWRGLNVMDPREWVKKIKGAGQHLASLPEGFKNGLKLSGPRPVLSLAVMLAGFVMLNFVVINLQGVGRGWQVLAKVQNMAEGAFQNLAAGGAAMAETDLDGSEMYFKDAETLLKDAQSEMNRALASSQWLLRYLDVTGTVKSGESLLKVGEDLTVAGQHIVRGVKPLFSSSVLKEDGEGSKGTLVDNVGAARSEFELAAAALTAVEKNLAKVDSPLLPEEVVTQVELLKNTVPKIKSALVGFNEQSDLLLTVLGADRDQQYLVLFQNNYEIRPTGGFIGSIGVVNIDRGAVEEIDIRSVYDGDGQLKDYIQPPEPLSVITNRWYLRDSNWFVDFPVSAEKAADFLEKEGGPTVDGVIALTPEVIKELLAVTGPIEVPEYEVVVDADNFWEVTQDQVTYNYDQSQNKPKQFMADLTPVLLNKLLVEPNDTGLAVLNIFMKMVKEKQLMFYLKHEEAQEKLVKAGWAGAVPRDKPGMLAVINSNVAGHKSDQFVEQEIEHEVQVMENGDLDVVTTIRRTHNGPTEASDYEYPEDENPAAKDNIIWQRVLVPKGAELIAAEGFTSRSQIRQFADVGEPLGILEADPEVTEWQRGQVEDESGTIVGEEAGYTFFGNWLVTRPGETSVAWYRYRVPGQVDMPNWWDPAQRWEVLMFKQPGDTRTSVRVSVRLPDNVRIKYTVPENGITQLSGNEVVYRGRLNQDLLIGTVFVRQ